MSLGTLSLLVGVLLLVGALPSWPHSRGWGHGPQRRAGPAGPHRGRAATHGADMTALRGWHGLPG
jgi:hypothetical protein